MKQLNKNKAPDTLPNEIFTHANHNTRELYLKEINKLIQTHKIPDQGNYVKSQYYAKEQAFKGKCSTKE